MAIQKDTISINLAKGMDTKDDDKISGPDQMTVVRDGRFTQDKRIVKRGGLTAQGTTTITSFPNALPLGTSSLNTKVFAHENQLLLENQGALYSQYEGQNAWAFKGNYFPIGVSTAKISGTIAFVDSVTSNGMTALASAGTSSSGSTANVIYLREDATGNIISSSTVTSVYRLLAFTNAIWVLSGTGSGTLTLQAQQFSFTTGSLGAPVSLQTDLGTFATPGNISVTHTGTTSAIGEAAFISYPSVSSVNKIFPMLSSGSIPALGTLNSGTNTGGNNTVLYCEPSINPNKIYLYYGGVKAWTFGTASYTATFTASGTVFSNLTPQSGTYTFNSTASLAMALNPVNTNELLIFNSTYVYPNNVSSTSSTIGIGANLYFAGLNGTTGSASTGQTLYGQGLMIAANAIFDNSRKSVYVPCTFTSPLQSSYVLVDILKGRADYTMWAQGKWLYGEAAQAKYNSQCMPTVAGGDVYRFTNNGNIVDIDLSPSIAPSSQYFAKTSHLSGGLLWAFDGQTVAEHNFLFAPEIVNVWAGPAAASLGSVVPGSASSPQSFVFTFGNGNAQYSGYLSFSATTGIPKDWYVWFTIDGTGSDPAPGGKTAIPVTLLSTDNPDEVAYKVQQSMNSVISSAQFNYTFTATGQLTLTAKVNGTATAPANSLTSTSGSLSTGSYQYSVVWKWTDRNGQIYRSAPSVAITATQGGSNGYNSLVICCPAITNKAFADVYVELYRTAANGVEFNQVTSFPAGGVTKTWSGTVSRVAYYDNASDASIAANGILYTNGGILENYNIGACNSVSYFKERLMATPTDDSLAVYYSKSNVPGEPVNFTAEEFFRVDADPGGIVATSSMDDKEVVFKNSKIYVLAGDGANDLGQGSTLSPPQLIASDVGATDPNSVILYPGGLLFKSDKGIYQLDRSLGVQYIGSPMEQYNSNKISGAVLMDSITEIRFMLSDSSVGMIYNYFFNRWDITSNYQCDSACIWQNNLVLGANSGIVSVESANYYDLTTSGGTSSYSLYIETPWLKLKGIQDFQRILQLMLLGEWLSAHTLSVNISYDYNSSSSDTFTFDATSQPTGAYQFRVFPKVQKCEAIKIKITENPGAGTQQGLIVNELGASVGLKRGLMKLPAGKTAV